MCLCGRWISPLKVSILVMFEILPNYSYPGLSPSAYPSNCLTVGNFSTYRKTLEYFLNIVREDKTVAAGVDLIATSKTVLVIREFLLTKGKDLFRRIYFINNPSLGLGEACLHVPAIFPWGCRTRLILPVSEVRIFGCVWERFFLTVNNNRLWLRLSIIARWQVLKFSLLSLKALHQSLSTVGSFPLRNWPAGTCTVRRRPHRNRRIDTMRHPIISLLLESI